MDILFKEILAYVMLQMGVSLQGLPLPEVKLTSAEEFNQMVVCENFRMAHAPCPVEGLYLDGVVYITDKDPSLNDIRIRGILIHEFVHYVQDKAGYFHVEGTCMHRRLEKLAYQIQNRYLLNAGGQYYIVNSNKAASLYTCR